MTSSDLTATEASSPSLHHRSDDDGDRDAADTTRIGGRDEDAFELTTAAAAAAAPHTRTSDTPTIRPSNTTAAAAAATAASASIAHGMSENPAHGATENLRSRGSSDTSQQSSASEPLSALWSSIEGDTGTPQSEVAARGVGQSGVNMAQKMDQALPENDGMQSLRSKLQEIRQLALSTEEKAKRMHAIMTQDYLAHQAAVRTRNIPAVNGVVLSGDDGMVLDPYEGTYVPTDSCNPYEIRPGDLEPCFSPLPPEPSDAEADPECDMELDRPLALGCMHYKRNVKIQCFDCHLWFPCRHCHDAAHDLPFPHNLNRKKTRNMLCMLCRTPQPAGEVCVNCTEYAAWYYCSKCKLWDNDSTKRIYHCDDCGICRRGEGLGKDYVHCKRCNVCISIASAASHPCVERATEGDCPLCLVNLFESSSSVVRLPCGHYMHGLCYKDLMSVTYKCPVCSKSAVNMDVQWRKLDDEIAAQPMPEDDEDLEGLLPHIEGHGAADPGSQQQRRPRSVWVICNDCSRKSSTLFHWLGLKCMECGSYNTNQTTPIGGGESEAERLIRQHGFQAHQEIAGDTVLRDAGIGMPDHERADSAVGVPTSPSQNPVDVHLAVPTSPSQLSSDSRGSGAQSPGRRYFVQQEEQRRASFTAPRFSTPSMPNLPRPSLPRIPDMPQLPRMPDMPNLPNIPNLPNLPNIPNLPNMPNLELPRFSPYEMMQAVSRSLSPMRYYLEGLDMREGLQPMAAQEIAHHRSASDPEPVHSQLTEAMGLGAKRAVSVGVGQDAAVFWGRAVSDGEEDGSEEGDDDDEGDDGGGNGYLRAASGGDDSSSASGSGSDASDSDADMADGEGLEEEEEDLELFGHR